MKKLNLILFLLLILLGGSYAQNKTGGTSSPKKYLNLKYNDCIPDTEGICFDSSHVELFKTFLADSLRDKEMKTQVNDLIADFNVFKKKAELGAYNKAELWLKILSFCLLALVIVLFVFMVLLRKDLNQEAERIGKRKKEIDSLKEEIQRINSNLSNQRTKSSDGEIHELKSKIASLENAIHKKADHETQPQTNQQQVNTVEQEKPSSQPENAQKLLYADSIIDGAFSRVREQANDDTIFVLKLDSDTRASVSLYRQAYGKVIANPSFLEGCEKQLIGNNNVEIVKEGEAVREVNGKWKVIRPLKVTIR